MSSSTISPYKNATEQVVFALQAENQFGATYIVSGRTLSAPYGITVMRKLASGSRNDHVELRVFRTEPNATTGKSATLQLLLDISVPKDQSILTALTQKEMLTLLMSVLRDYTASAATFNNATALIEGRNL